MPVRRSFSKGGIECLPAEALAKVGLNACPTGTRGPAHRNLVEGGLNEGILIVHQNHWGHDGCCLFPGGD
jgi:hypothetical protein